MTSISAATSSEPNLAFPDSMLPKFAALLLKAVGLLLAFAAFLKVYYWPDAVAFELLPLLSLHIVWSSIAVVELIAGLAICLSRSMRRASLVVVTIASLFLVMNAFLYLSNQRECICFANLKFGVAWMAAVEFLLIFLAFLLSFTRLWGLAPTHMLVAIAIGLALGFVVTSTSQSRHLFVWTGVIEFKINTSNRLANVAIVAEAASPMSKHEVDVVVIATDEPVTVTGYNLLGALPSDQLPVEIAPNARKRIKVRFRTTRRTGDYLIKGFVFTNADIPQANKFYVSGTTQMRPNSSLELAQRSER